MDPIFARAQDLGIPMLILTGASRMPDLARILDRYPDVDCCIDHMADAHPDNPQERQWLMDMARYPRVYVKISHTWSISQQSYPWADTHAMVEEVYQTFGGATHYVGHGLAGVSVARLNTIPAPDGGARRDEVHRAGGSGVGAGQDGVEAVESFGEAVRC